MAWRNTTLTIASGGTLSQELDLTEKGARRIKNITFFVPAVLTGIIKVQTAPAPGGTFSTLNDGFGNDYTLVPGKSQILAGITAGALRLISDTNEGADRVFTLVGASQV